MYFLGYGEATKGYKLYDLCRSKVIYSRDVQFNERSEAGQEVFTEEDKHRVELEFTTDVSTNDLFEIEVTSNNHENNTPSMNTQPVMRRSERTTRAPVFLWRKSKC